VTSSDYRQFPSRRHRRSKSASKRWAVKGIYYLATIHCRAISRPIRRIGPLELGNFAAVLTHAESDARVGALSCNELKQAWILHPWGFLPLVCNSNSSPRYISDSVGYAGWLPYCIAWDHCFGVVYVALLQSWMYKLPLPELGKPNSALYHDTCICTDGVHTANWEAPVLEMQGYKMLNVRKRGRGARRVWDICANRVIPWADSLEPQAIMPISHAWVAPEDREYIVTSVNHYLWPVPLPRGVQLEDIRKELI